MRSKVLSAIVISSMLTMPQMFSAGGIEGELSIHMPDNVPLLTSFEVWDEAQKLNVSNVKTSDLNAIVTSNNIRFSEPGVYTVTVELEGKTATKTINVGSPELYMDLPFDGYILLTNAGEELFQETSRVRTNNISKVYGVVGDKRAEILSIEASGNISAHPNLQLNGSIVRLKGGEM